MKERNFIFGSENKLKTILFKNDVWQILAFNYYEQLPSHF